MMHKPKIRKSKIASLWYLDWTDDYTYICLTWQESLNLAVHLTQVTEDFTYRWRYLREVMK